jgi:hypothetical protein
MAKRKSRHSVSRKLKHHHSRRAHSRRAHRRHPRKTHRRHRRRGGVAPVNYSLAGNWSSKMSTGQGADYFKYHEGQHGGAAPFPGSVTDSMLPAALRQAAHVGGIDKAITDVQGLRDPNQSGGRRKHRKCHSRKHHSRKHHSRKHSRRHRRRGGSHLGYAPFPNKGMLLDSSLDYARAGLNPEWRGVEVADAKIREGQ